MLSSARGPPPSALLPGGRGVILHYKFLALAENVVIDVVLHGDEYDDWDGTNHDDNNAADAGNDCPRGGGCCRRQLQAGSSRHSRPSAGAGANCHFGSSCHCRTPSAMSGGGGYGRGLRRRTCCDHVQRGRLPAGNEAIDQDDLQRVIGRRRTPSSSPLQFCQPTVKLNLR